MALARAAQLGAWRGGSGGGGSASGSGCGVWRGQCQWARTRADAACGGHGFRRLSTLRKDKLSLASVLATSRAPRSLLSADAPPSAAAAGASSTSTDSARDALQRLCASAENAKASAPLPQPQCQQWQGRQ